MILNFYVIGLVRGYASLVDGGGRFNPCNTGMKYNGIAGRCEDINECEPASGSQASPCYDGQECINTPGR